VSKVILIVCDALRNDVAAAEMGYLEGLAEEKKAARYTAIAGLPTLSRPLYETIQTGTSANEHGIVANTLVQRSTTPSIFQVAREHGKTTAAAAYHWISELYVRAPYDVVSDRELEDENCLIQHGRFYQQDDYPDIELFATGGMLVQKYFPDYVLIHPMGLDYVGHQYGGGSKEYRRQAILQDQIMARLIPLVLMVGYHVLVTGDHGMNADGNHNGTLPDVRHVPLYIIPADGAGEGDTGKTVSQLQIAPTVCHLLGIPPATTMKHPVIS
jgi:predicted AlkP superfamily pyrophosphatase or phosphodiesterase